jgi:hypothetical protein
VLDNSIGKDMFCHLIRVNHVRVKDGKTKILQIVFAEYLWLDSIAKDTKQFTATKTLIGNIDQIKSRFEIIQRVKI